jgi:hypothetical protein
MPRVESASLMAEETRVRWMTLGEGLTDAQLDLLLQVGEEVLRASDSADVSDASGPHLTENPTVSIAYGHGDDGRKRR